MTNTENYVHILLDTLSSKERVMKDILAITKEQEVIANGDSLDEDGLEATLTRKEVLIEELNKLDFGFDAAYGHIRSEIIKNKDKYRSEIGRMQSIIKGCTDVGVEISTLEQRNKSKLEVAFSVRKKEIKQMKTSNEVASNYYKTMSKTQVVNPYFMDKKK